MSAKYLSDMSTAIAPALANHLWQSTLFVITVGLLTLSLRKNCARARYWLWLAASVKFLVPFSLLATVGKHLAWSRGSVGTNAAWYFAIDEVGQPFTQPAMSLISHASHTTLLSSMIPTIPVLLAAAWFCGFVVVLVVWYARWRRIAAVIKNAVPLREGRELEVLRRLERIGGLRKRLEMLLSRTRLEPGIFGIARPVLIWPEGISECLEGAQVEAILAHEVGHVRHRDNLTAAVHMVVEAIFWFHPLVWWLGARLVKERELACDEEVLALGSERQVYAASILKTCEFCVGSPLACVSGVTGADLNERIVRIMTEKVVHKLGFSKKLLLIAAGSLAVVVPLVFSQVDTAQEASKSRTHVQGTSAVTPVYEVASIKPNKSDNNMTRLMYTPDGLSATGVALQAVIGNAYGIPTFQISGAPSWLKSEKYDIEAKMATSVADELKKLSPDEVKLERSRMLQKLLAERCKLTVHMETKELPVYALVVAKNGPRFQESKPGDTYVNGFKGPDGRSGSGLMHMEAGKLTGQGVPMASLVGFLSRQLDRTVVDKTGLTGKYDFTFQWTPDQRQPQALKGSDGGQPGSDSALPESPGPSIFTALQEQLGLKLESQKGPVMFVVIDHVEKPSEN